MKIESKNFVALADIAIQDGQVPQAVGKGTRTAYDRRITAMYSVSWEHGEKIRQQAAEAKRRALRQLPDLLEQARTKPHRKRFYCSVGGRCSTSQTACVEYCQRTWHTIHCEEQEYGN